MSVYVEARRTKNNMLHIMRDTEFGSVTLEHTATGEEQLEELTTKQIQRLNYITCNLQGLVKKEVTDEKVADLLCTLNFDDWEDLVKSLQEDSSFKVNDLSHRQILWIVRGYSDQTMQQLNTLDIRGEATQPLLD